MLHHATLEIRREQLDACVPFYSLLGFERVEPPRSLADRAAWLQGGATQIHLMWVDEPVSLPRGHVAVVVDNYEAAAGRWLRPATSSSRGASTGARPGVCP